jgi:hypothetical protein
MTVNVILPKERQIEWLNAYILLWDVSNTEMNPAGYSAEQIEEHLVNLYRQFCSIQKLPLMSADELIIYINNNL